MANVDLEKYDIRVIQRYLRNGTIDQATYDAWLAGLPDDSELVEETEAKFTPSEGADSESADS